jgi:hypothetical protein
VLISRPVGTWSEEGAEYSRRVFLGLAIGVDVDGTKEARSTSVRTRWGEPKWVLDLLMSDSGSLVKFGGKSRPVIHYLSSSSIDKEDNQCKPALRTVLSLSWL